MTTPNQSNTWPEIPVNDVDKQPIEMGRWLPARILRIINKTTCAVHIKGTPAVVRTHLLTPLSLPPTTLLSIAPTRPLDCNVLLQEWDASKGAFCKCDIDTDPQSTE